VPYEAISKYIKKLGLLSHKPWQEVIYALKNPSYAISVPNNTASENEGDH
jgi:hypothetical protein